MRFYNQILLRSFEITQKNPSDLKVLVSDKYNFPSIDEDNYGPILLIPKPVKKKDGFALNGVIFQNNELGRTLLMRMAMSTVEHLSVHTRITDFSLYNNWLRGKDPKLAVFAVDLIEDLCVKAYVKTGLKGLLPGFALSNAVSYALITKPEEMNSRQVLMQSALLSYFIAGRCRYLLPSDIKKDVLMVLAQLNNFEKLLLHKCAQSPASVSWGGEDVKSMKIKLADSMYKRLAKHGSPKQTLYLPYTDCHQGIERINEELVFDMGESIEILANTYRTLGLALSTDKSLQEILGASFSEEASSILHDLMVEQNWKDRLVQHYMGLAKNTEFDDFVFPAEDYAEYYRSYRTYAGSIRKILDQIRILKNDIDGNPHQEIGQIDIQEVIQAIAAEKMNRNVFIRDDYLTKNESWGILLDMSSSLEPFSLTARDMSLCLAEVAKELIPGKEGWGLYAFSNKFAVVKDISEEYNANVKARIGGLGKGGLSYIPDAIQLGANIVSSTGKDNNFLFLISDGLPSGYSGIETKLEQTAKKLSQRGVTVVNVGLGSNGLKKYFRHTSLSAESVYDLMGKFAKTYFSLSST